MNTKITQVVERGSQFTARLSRDEAAFLRAVLYACADTIPNALIEVAKRVAPSVGVEVPDSLLF